MMATAFLGYQHSPKWFDISNKGNTTNYKVKKFFNKSMVKRGYHTNDSSNKAVMSERLEIIINELGLNPIYVYENLNLEDTRKQILDNTRGLSGIYMIMN